MFIVVSAIKCSTQQRYCEHSFSHSNLFQFPRQIVQLQPTPLLLFLYQDHFRPLYIPSSVKAPRTSPLMTFETSKSTLIRAQLLFNHSITFYSNLYKSVLKHYGVNISYFLLFGDPLFTLLDHLLWKNVNTRVYKWRLTTLNYTF